MDEKTQTTTVVTSGRGIVIVESAFATPEALFAEAMRIEEEEVDPILREADELIHKASELTGKATKELPAKAKELNREGKELTAKAKELIAKAQELHRKAKELHCEARQIALMQLVEKSIREASRIYYDVEWSAWAQTWLSGERSTHAAEAQWHQTEHVFNALIWKGNENLEADRALAACYAAEAAFHAAGDQVKMAVAADKATRFARYVLAVDRGDDECAAWNAAFDDVTSS